MDNPFVAMMKEIRQGATLDELADALQNTVRAVRATGKKGEVILRLVIKPASKGDVNILMFEDLVTEKLPKPERGTSILFADDDGELSRHDPRQPKLPELREAPRPAASFAKARDAAK